MMSLPRIQGPSGKIAVDLVVQPFGGRENRASHAMAYPYDACSARICPALLPQVQGG
jgi:hypothetical protein